VRDYTNWWPWLSACDARSLAAGEEWRCEVHPPIPQPVRFRVIIEEIEEPALVRAQVLGDVIGKAILTLDESDVGCVMRLRTSLAPGNRTLRLVSSFTGPIARFAHDWVLDNGARQFVDHAVAPVLGD
jgi:hypothetical protein